ncbi:MAG: hypothetical protein K1060chlam1_01443 [Candidatus Anoxychlamydiales bacterium]|nr:hypothetical protein [Candidatus Anoxychlamydiales bacterium]
MVSKAGHLDPSFSNRYSPVKIKPENLERDITARKVREHESLVKKLKFEEDGRYAVWLLIEARKLRIIGRPSVDPKKNLISTNKHTDLDKAERLLRQARSLKIQGLPEAVPETNLKKFNEDLSALINKAIRSRFLGPSMSAFGL